MASSSSGTLKSIFRPQEASSFSLFDQMGLSDVELEEPPLPEPLPSTSTLPQPAPAPYFEPVTTRPDTADTSLLFTDSFPQVSFSRVDAATTDAFLRDIRHSLGDQLRDRHRQARRNHRSKFHPIKVPKGEKDKDAPPKHVKRRGKMAREYV